MTIAKHACAAAAAVFAFTAASSPVLADPKGGPPPGIAKKPGGTPPGLAKKPGGLPPGQAKKIWNRGQYLPKTYLDQRYNIQPSSYRLPAAPAGYRWVLVQDNAYMVQNETGLINQVAQIASALLR